MKMYSNSKGIDCQTEFYVCKLKIVHDLNFQAKNISNYKYMPITYITYLFLLGERVFLQYLVLPQTHSNPPSSTPEY